SVILTPPAATTFFPYTTLFRSVSYLLIWIACTFVSILIHELGHVFMGRLFGSHGHIVLYSFGGLAIGSSALRSRWQRIAVYFAGDRKSTRLNSSHVKISYAVFC